MGCVVKSIVRTFDELEGGWNECRNLIHVCTTDHDTQN